MTRFTRIAAIVLLLLALLLGVYAWMLGRKPVPAAAGTASSAPVGAEQRQILYPVVVAAKPLAAGQKIEPSAVRVVQLPIRPADALTEVAAAVGRVPVHDLGEHTPLIEGQLASGLALRLEAGERAVAVKADEVMGVGNRIRPGDFVDVFFVLKTDSREVERGQARLLLPRLRVLAFGSASVDGGPARGASGDGRADGGSQRPEIARTAVLAVSVEDVNRLALADANARLLLALRRPDDTDMPDPALFADLPPALQPLPGRGTEAARAPLQGLDRAHAGLAAADLAVGGAAARPARAVAQASPAPSAAGLRRVPSGSAGVEVEVIRGAQRDMVRY